MNKVRFNINFQYLGDEYGLIPFIDIKYIDENGKEYGALENILLNKNINNQLLANEEETRTLKLIEECCNNATELNCEGVLTTGGSYVASKGSIQNSLFEIPSSIKISPRFLLNKDISIQDKCSIISKTFLSIYYNSLKKNVIGFGKDNVKSLDFEFFYGNIDIKDLEIFSTNMDAMLCTMIINHHNRRSQQFIDETFNLSNTGESNKFIK